MSLSDRYLDWKNLCVNKILFNVVYSQNNMLLKVKFVIFLCSVISQGMVVTLDRWGGKWNHLSMTPRLTTDYAKNYCNRTLIVKVIIENVVTCFVRDTVYRPIAMDGSLIVCPKLRTLLLLTFPVTRSCRQHRKCLVFVWKFSLFSYHCHSLLHIGSQLPILPEFLVHFHCDLCQLT